MVVLFIPESGVSFEEKVQQLNQVRQVRSCEGNLLGDTDVEGHPLLDSYLPFSFTIQIGIIAAGILVIILVLGALKGVLGLLVYTPIGMLGLGYLVDLPRTLNRYQESELSQMRVIYDNVGWPIHPQTGKRTVRAITKRMEFCVNVVFFIAFPLVIIISILSACFSHKTYDADDGGECYHKVNTIMLSDTPSLKLLAKGCTSKGSGDKVAGKEPCPTKGTCSKDCKHLPNSKSPAAPITSKSKSKSSSSGTAGKSSLKSPKSSGKSSGKSNDSAKSKSSKAKSGASKSKSNKSKTYKSKTFGKGGSPKRGKAKSKASTKSTYKDNDSAEDADTQYVLNQMKTSEMSLQT